MARILLVDDDVDVREMLKLMLERSGHVVETAQNGRAITDNPQALDTDLVLTDILMPDVEGVETINALRAERPDLPVIAMSGGDVRVRDHNLRIAQLLGASAVLRKPFTQGQLDDAIEQTLSDQSAPADKAVNSD